MNIRLVALLAVVLSACSASDEPASTAGDGGSASTGGTAAADGAGGTATATGGFVAAAGGAPGGTGAGGGAPTAGGAPGTGGTGAAGGAPTAGGAPGAGGAPTATCPATASLTPGETTRTIQVGDAARTYLLHVPPGYTGQTAVPLVVDFHPLFGTGAGQRDSSGYRALSDTEGFVVAWPDGIDNAWNVGPCCTRSRTVDDVAFARALVAEVKAQGCIDAKRVFATGFSMGGGMSHYLGCHAADVFAAVAPAAFDLLTENEGTCNPSRPISVMSFRGTADFVVPYAGGASNPPNGLPVTIHFLGARGTHDRWKVLNGCNGIPIVSGSCETFSACAEGVEVTLCTATGGGHVAGDARLGWEMMKRHPMP